MGSDERVGGGKHSESREGRRASGGGTGNAGVGKIGTQWGRGWERRVGEDGDAKMGS